MSNLNNPSKVNHKNRHTSKPFLQTKVKSMNSYSAPFYRILKTVKTNVNKNNVKVMYIRLNPKT